MDNLYGILANVYRRQYVPQLHDADAKRINQPDE